MDVNYTMTDANGTSVFSGNISSSTTLNPGYAARPDLPEGNLWLNVTTGDSLGKVRTQVWNYTVDSSNSHQVNVTVSGNHLTTPSLILGPTGRLVPGNPSDDSKESVQVMFHAHGMEQTGSMLKLAQPMLPQDLRALFKTTHLDVEVWTF